MKIYDLTLKILKDDEQARNSDKECIWQVYKALGIIKEVNYFGSNEAILKNNFLSGNNPPFESITRARRKIQELYPELQATNSNVRARRSQKQESKGTFIYREQF